MIQIYLNQFGHWVFESAVYLPLFHVLKTKYSNLKLVLKEKKKFKEMFCNFFFINNEDVLYEIPEKNNVCLFPSPISPLNNNIYNDRCKKILERFIKIFNEYVCINDKNYDCVVMPRQSLENYGPNDRTYDFNWVYKNLEDNFINYDMLNTDTLTSLNSQITRIRSSKNVILTDGSPFMVNCILCNNMNIFVIDSYLVLTQMKTAFKTGYIIELSQNFNNNKIYHVTNKNSDLAAFLKTLL